MPPPAARPGPFAPGSRTARGRRRAGRPGPGPGRSRNAAYQRSSSVEYAEQHLLAGCGRALARQRRRCEAGGGDRGPPGGAATLRPMPTTTADPSDDCSARMPASLRVAGQHVVGPLEHRVDARHRPHGGRHRDPGEQRQPAPPRRGHGRGPQQHGEGQRRAGPARPGPAEPAAPRRLLLGDEHLPLGAVGSPPREQVGVGRAGARHDVERRPHAMGRGQEEPARVLLIVHCLRPPGQCAAPCPLSRRPRCAAGGSPCPCSRP